MAGAITFSSGESWFINGWGWRILMARAIQEAAGDFESDRFEQGLHLHGLNLNLVDPVERVGIAKALMTSATALKKEYGDQGGQYDAGYVEKLVDLARLLKLEIPAEC